MFMRYGHIPDYGLFFRSQNVFYFYGLMMYPMTVIHPWNLLVLTYAIGILYAGAALADGEDGLQPKFIFFLSVLGVGIFTYFQGRSMDGTLPYVSYPALIIVAIFTDLVAEKIKQRRSIEHGLVFICLILFMIFTVAGAIKNIPVLWSNVDQNLRIANEKVSTPVTRNAEFIRSQTKRGDEILILSYLSGMYYLASETSNPVKIPSLAEMIFKSDYETLFSYLKSTDKEVIFDFLADSRNQCQQYFRMNFMTAGSNLPACIPLRDILEKEFIVKAVSPDGNIAVLKRRGY
jgi:hypothetical protein